MTPAIVRYAQAAVVAIAATAAAAAAQESSSSRLQLLDVPYIPQSEALCGGAAAAMVMRYWGATGVYAESFADLVDRAVGGIRADDLVRSLRGRGFRATSVAGDAALVMKSLAERRPPVVLIEDRPGRFHYVVLVGWHGGKVVLHDPARAPFRILDEDEFLRAWGRSDRWTLLVLPDAASVPPEHDGSAAEGAAAPAAAPGTGACGGMVDEGVRLANAGALEDARQLLELATVRCARDAAAWRELAGVHAVRRNWRQAASHARRALAIDRGDEHAARILATSLYLEGDSAGALNAWNLVGEPVIDIVDVRGLDRTRFGVAAAALRLAPRTLLTSAGLTQASRRLDAIPSFLGSRVTYAPAADGRARVAAAVLERSVLPTTPVAMAAGALALATDRELRVDVASPTGGGELWQAAWRWWEARRRLSIGLRAPAPFGGVWGVEGAAAQETFGPAGQTTEERRRRATVTITDWATSRLAWDVTAGVERWASGTTATAGGGLRYLLARDRLTFAAQAGAWTGAERTWTGSASVEWRSSTAHEGSVWLSTMSVEAAGRAAPLALWAGAGTGQGRSHLLRAHPLLDDGVIRDGVFGRRLSAGSFEWRWWGPRLRGVVRLAPAAFIDVAQAHRVPAFADPRAHADVGGGVRIALPGAGVVRADLARGLRDGKMALSIGWTR